MSTIIEPGGCTEVELNGKKDPCVLLSHDEFRLLREALLLCQWTALSNKAHASWDQIKMVMNKMNWAYDKIGAFDDDNQNEA